MWMINLFFQKILNVIFPARCYVCHKDSKPICGNCLKNFIRCVDTPLIYSTSIYSFKDKNIRKIIHAIKYYHRRDLIEPLARELSKAIQSEIYGEQVMNELDLAKSYKLIANSWTLVPIPMTKMRKYMRGYNQAELIAKEISEKTDIPLRADILIRNRNSKRQVKSSIRSERLKNQHKSFEVVGDINKINIILVDDVITTGATISEAYKILNKSGAGKIIAVSIAH